MSGRSGVTRSGAFKRGSAAAVSRLYVDKATERPSVFDFMTRSKEWDVRNGLATMPVHAELQAALNAYADASMPLGLLELPAGKFRLEAPIVFPEHVNVIGHLSDSRGAGMPGTEIAWYGASGVDAVTTSTGDNLDWSRASVQRLRIKNYTAAATGRGLVVRNPQNGSYLRDVFVSGFPERQLLVYEPATRGAGLGTCPGYFAMDNVFAIGGLTPMEIRVGVEHLLMQNCGVDTDATSTRGMLLTRANGQTQRAPLKMLGSKVEIQQVTGDVNGIEWDQDLAVSFDSVAVQRNDNIASTKAAFHYSGAARNIPTAQFHNCTSWNLANLYKLNAAGIARAAAAINTPESFSWNPSAADTAFMFGKETLTQNLGTTSMNTANSANFAGLGYVVTRPCFLAGLSARHTATITAGSITLSVIKNGAQFVQSLVLNAANQGRYNDLTTATAINSSNFQFAPGDRVSMQVATDATFAPANGHVLAELFFRPL